MAALIERHVLKLVGLVAALSGHKVCGILFVCGCSWFTASHCNIHQHVGPRCPWCVSAWPFMLAVSSWIAVAWVGIYLARKYFGKRTGTTLAGGFLGLAIGMFL